MLYQDEQGGEVATLAARLQALQAMIEDLRIQVTVMSQQLAGMGVRQTELHGAIAFGLCDETALHNRIRVDAKGRVLLAEQSLRELAALLAAGKGATEGGGEPA